VGQVALNNLVFAEYLEPVLPNSRAILPNQLPL